MMSQTKNAVHCELVYRYNTTLRRMAWMLKSHMWQFDNMLLCEGKRSDAIQLIRDMNFERRQNGHLPIVVGGM